MNTDLLLQLKGSLKNNIKDRAGLAHYISSLIINDNTQTPGDVYIKTDIAKHIASEGQHPHGVKLISCRYKDIAQTSIYIIKTNNIINYSDLYFIILSGQDQISENLKTVSWLARTLKDEDTCRKIRGCDTIDAVKSILLYDPAISQAA